MKHIDQIALVTAITKHLQKQGIELSCARQLNSVIQATLLIIREYEQPTVKAKPGMGLQAWLKSDDTGSSSLFMAYYLADGPKAEYAYPRDPDDFGRCYRFLRAVPKKDRQAIGFMNDASGIWASLVSGWEEMELLWEQESPTGKCPKLYALISNRITIGELDEDEP